MSDFRYCVRCDAGFETGLGSDRETCRKCEQMAERLANGGLSLSGSERAAVAEFLGFEIGDGGSAFPVEGRLNGMVWGPEDEGGFKDFDAVEPINAFSPEAI